MASPVRRVLGDKDVNAALSPRRQHPTKAAALELLSAAGINALEKAPVSTATDDSKKRSLDENPHKASSETDASLGHVNKRPKQNPSGEDDHVTRNDTSIPVPTASEVTQPLSTSRALPADSTALTSDPPTEDTADPDRESSQAMTLADSVSEPTFAETLRLRLRVAMYKIRTDQVSAPLSRLEISASTPSTPKPELAIRDPPADAMRQFRKTSRKARHRRPQHPRREHEPQLYAPYDARLATGSEDAAPEKMRYIHSSSPACSDCECDAGPGPDDDDDESTPITPAPGSSRARLPQSGDGAGYADPFAIRPFHSAPQSAERDLLTSSAVKGSAADSLLRLGSSM